MYVLLKYIFPLDMVWVSFQFDILSVWLPNSLLISNQVESAKQLSHYSQLLINQQRS